MNSTLVSLLLLLVVFQLKAQQPCGELTVNIENSIRSNESVKLMLITFNDTIVGKKDGNHFCFNDSIFLKEAVDVVIEVSGERLLYPSLFLGFLKINDSPKWIVGFDKKPFVKKNYPRIEEWRNVEVIEYFEVQPQSDEDSIMMFKRRKDGSYID